MRLVLATVLALTALACNGDLRFPADPVDGGPDSAGCDPGLTSCAGACVDLSSDPTSCGACGHACAAGLACESGLCGCATGTSDCGGTCVDLSSDHEQCGACGTTCNPSQVCEMGRCAKQCSAATTTCNGGCVNLTNNPRNCGACSVRCVLGEMCSQSACRCAGPCR